MQVVVEVACVDLRFGADTGDEADDVAHDFGDEFSFDVLVGCGQDVLD